MAETRATSSYPSVSPSPKGSTTESIVRSLLSLWVIFICISAEKVKLFTFQQIPNQLAIIFGFFMTTPICFLGLPALGSAIIGILGTPTTWPYLIYNTILSLWNGPSGRATQWGLLDFIWGIVATLFRYVVPPIPVSKDSTKGLAWLLFKEPCMHYPPDPSQITNAKVKDEIWIYINGVATTKAIADANRELLFEIFSRPIHLVHNPTDSILVDLLECAAGKIGIFQGWEPEPRDQLKQTIKAQLEIAKNSNGSIRKVVLIAHSQGTIVTGNALKELGGNNDDGSDSKTKQLMKQYLEVFNFADCAQTMPASNVKYLENICNECDLVGWLGHLFPFPSFWEDVDGNPIDITGIPVKEPCRWGHLLNSHYLLPMLRDGAYRKSKLVKEYMMTKND